MSKKRSTEMKVRDMRRATHRHYSFKEKRHVVLEGDDLHVRLTHLLTFLHRIRIELLTHQIPSASSDVGVLKWANLNAITGSFLVANQQIERFPVGKLEGSKRVMGLV